MPTARSVPSMRIEAGVERERLALRQHGPPRGEALDADLRPLQVAEHRHVLADRRGRAPHALDATPMVGGLTVREIDPDDVRAAADDVLEHGLGVGGRAEGGDDLGTTQHWKGVVNRG